MNFILISHLVAFSSRMKTGGERDSNPRYGDTVYTLSRRAPSATRTPLQLMICHNFLSGTIIVLGYGVSYIPSMTVLSLFLVMGIFLGLVGAGGSILSIPILTYGVGMSMVKAGSFSLAIVGLVAMMAVVRVREV